MFNIYVGNLSFDTTEDEVRDLFAAHGEVLRVNLITDRDTGRPRGFGFVEMADASQGKTAIEQKHALLVDKRVDGGSSRHNSGEGLGLI